MVDEVYRAFAGTAVDAKGDVKVPASAFTLAGASLAASATRTIIIRGGSPSMPAYQLVRVTFNPPKSWRMPSTCGHAPLPSLARESFREGRGEPRRRRPSRRPG